MTEICSKCVQSQVSFTQLVKAGLKPVQLASKWCLDNCGVISLTVSFTLLLKSDLEASMVQDVPRDRYIIFGGHDDKDLGNRNDLWAFHPASWAWEELDEADTWNKPANEVCDFPPDFTNVDYDAPERRNAAVFVAGPDAAWLTGGKTDCGAVDDLVRLDLETATWEDRTTATVGVTCLRKGGLNCNDLCF